MIKCHDALPNYTACTGKLVELEIVSHRIPKLEMAKRLGVSESTLYRLISGEIPLSPAFARKLEYVLGIPSEVWNNHELGYRQDLVRLYEVGTKEEEWVKSQPVRELSAMGLVKGKNIKELFRSLMAFYQVGDVKGWNLVWKKSCGDGERAAFARCAEILAENLKCKGYDRQKLKTGLAQLLAFGRETSAAKTLLMAEKGLAKSGVAMKVFKAGYGNVRGVTRWKSQRLAIVGLSPQGESYSGLFASLLHEMHHMLRQKRLTSYLSCGTGSKEEEKAEHFAYEMLLPSRADEEVRACKNRRDLEAVARKYDRALFIVAGRYALLTGDRKKFARLDPIFRWPKGVWHL